MQRFLRRDGTRGEKKSWSKNLLNDRTGPEAKPTVLAIARVQNLRVFDKFYMISCFVLIYLSLFTFFFFFVFLYHFLRIFILLSIIQVARAYVHRESE